MTLTTLTIAPQDVSARALALRLGGPRPAEILAERTLTSAASPCELSLGIIGASHVVDVSFPSDATSPSLAPFREEISCHAHEGGRPLATGVVDKEEWGWAYRMSARHRVCTDGELAQSAREILAWAERGDEEWLVGTFPGAGDFHITALRGELTADGARWQTWHFYPEELTVVESASELVRKVNA